MTIFRAKTKVKAHKWKVEQTRAFAAKRQYQYEIYGESDHITSECHFTNKIKQG
jgi:hypothetical protein